MTRQVWRGVYANARDAGVAADEQSQAVWELESWLYRQRDLAVRTTELLRHGCQGPRPSSLPAIVAGAPKAVIVDLGGGSGWILELIRGLGLAPHRYVVRDLDPVIDFYREHPIPGVEYQYLADATHDRHSPTDVLYANSCLQYMPDNAGLIDQVRRLRPQTLLVDELPWSRSDHDWFTIQVNSDSSSVARFLSLRRLVAEVEQEGMKLVWISAFGAGHKGYAFPEMDDFPTELRIDCAKSLIFSRVR